MPEDRRPKSNWSWVLPVIFAAHLLLAVSTKGLDTSWLIIDGCLLTFVLVRSDIRLSIDLVFPIWIFLVAYFDILPQVLPYRGEIHVGDLYAAELHWFPIPGPSGPMISCALFKDRHWEWLDLLCGLVYMGEFPEIVLIGVGLWLHDRRRLPGLTWTFLLTNLAGFVTWVLYPAAPPWYVNQYGLGPANPDAPSSAGGLLRVDEILGTDFIQRFYDHSLNVFGAMPSVHVAVATVGACLAWRLPWRWSLPAAGWAGLMAFGAVYFQNHYVLDVLAGIGYAVTAFALVSVVQHALDHRAERVVVESAVEPWLGIAEITHNQCPPA
jgi:membrane-associated phospholipid phosphatase